MDAHYRSAASARSAWWRPTADALGIQLPLVTVECSRIGGGKLTTCFANFNDAVAAVITAWRLPTPKAGVRLDAIAPAVALAVAATYAVDVGSLGPAAAAAAAATQPTVALYDGTPASMVERWPTPDAMLAAIMPAAGGASHVYAAAAAPTTAGAPPMAPRRPSTVAMLYAAAGLAGNVAASATTAYRARVPAQQATGFYPAPAAAGVSPYPAAAVNDHHLGPRHGRRIGSGMATLVTGQVVDALVSHCIEGML